MALHPTIRIEGGLLGPDVVDQLLAGELPGQRAPDFGLEGRRNLTDEIAATFADARALWGMFQRRLERVPEDDVATTVTRDAWVIPFLGLLGYEPRYNQKSYEIDGFSFAISHRADEAEDSPPVHIVGFRQELGRVPASGRPRMAPHSLLQEYLNRTEHLWGVVTNGQTLRLLRDCTFVRRQAYVEFDLPAILDEQRFQDFASLYRVLHRTRLPRSIEDSENCLLEKYYDHSVKQGGRVREHLREGVEQCITLLANGFLRHPANDELRRRLSSTCAGSERITIDGFYRQMLILVYRFLFLLVSEDRGLLSANPLYREHYGIARFRRMLEQRAAFTDHDDLWQSLRVLWLVMTKDTPEPSLNNQTMAAALGLQVLNGDLFAAQSLDDFTLANRDLLEAFWYLSSYQESRTSPRRRVNYAALDVEELGSVYESLLEFHPTVDFDHIGRPVFSFITGSERKTTGSYYTPPELVAELIKSALDPVIATRLQPFAKQGQTEQKEKAILSIRVCDLACGSGHFLLAAARRLGKELARVRTGDEEPSPERVREAIRLCVSHCIYGVDRNPLAVDLCRVALWLESHTADKPLTFLDHRIRCGDSLVGVFDLTALAGGIPDKAFEPREGDDKAYARELTKRNRSERTGVRDLFAWAPTTSIDEWDRHSREVDSIPDDSPDAIRRKRRLFEESHEDSDWRKKKQACDLWTAAFFQPLNANAPSITSAVLADHLSGHPVDPRALGLAAALASRERFFHWPLEFPEVFKEGGFDAILSNPPWEHVELKEQEFFAVRDARIATAPTKSERGKMIRALANDNSQLFAEFTEALHAADSSRSFLAQSGRYRLTGRGRINTYAVFAELATSSTHPQGRAGLVLPKGIATDDTTKLFFAEVVETGRLIELVGFENEEFIFPAVDHRVTFCKIILGGGAKPVSRSRIAFYIRHFSQLAEESRFFFLERDDFWLLNPNTGNCPIFRTQADAELTKAIYHRVPVLLREAAGRTPAPSRWNLSFSQGLFNMASDSHHFRTAEALAADDYRLEGNVYVSPYDRYLPLYEAKMLHQFDHRFSTYEGATEKQLNVGILPQPTAHQKRDPAFVVQPRYWVREEVVNSVIPKYPKPLAIAITLEHRPSIQRVLCWWVAGHYLNSGAAEPAIQVLHAANQYDIDRTVEREFFADQAQDRAIELDRDYPLTESDALTILRQIDTPDEIAEDLVDRFSPRWFIGWRDITNAGNERTIIASTVPRAPIGHTFPIFLAAGVSPQIQLALLANLNSFIGDYVARQKVGGTHITYNLLKQFAILGPDSWKVIDTQSSVCSLQWLLPRVLELIYTSQDLRQLALDCGYDGKPFIWNDERRFELRCEIDAAFFHLYLPSDRSGQWLPVDTETLGQLTDLKKHFPTPREAIAFILDQFPQVRAKEEKAFDGNFRTKDRILELYDAICDT